MNRREFLRKSLEGIVIGTIPLISSCGKNPVKSESVNSSSIIRDNIEYYIRIDKFEYKLGEGVEISYKVINLKSKGVSLNTYQSPEFNILIQKDEENIWAARHTFYFYSPGVTISPGETLNNPRGWSGRNSSPYIWDMKYDEWSEDNKGKLIEPAIYDIIFVVYSYPKIEVAVPITIIKN